MQENSMDQPMSLSQLLRESYLAEALAHHRHGESSCIDSPRRLVYGTLKEKADDTEPQFPDLSAFLSQEELDKSVDLACKAFSSDPREREERSDAHPPTSHYNLPSNKPTPETEVISERQTVQTPIQDNAIRNVRSAREPAADFRRPQRNAPYGLETQSKKEFLNKAADFIEELSSLFKAGSSKRIRPRACKTHRSRFQNKTQLDGTSYSINAEDRERPILLNQQMEEPMEKSGVTEEPQEPALIQNESSEEPVCEPPHFIQKLKSREVPEGSKFQLDCIVRGLPAPEVRWFCEGKELENSPDIQIIANGERHTLIIAEAFEEDTGRYSCFASNFYGTDSTSAEIYIEGASSSDSDEEKHFQAELHERSPQSKPAVVLAEPNTSAEDTTPTITTTFAEPPAPSDTEAVPLTELIADPSSKQEDTELLSSKVVSSEIPVLEPTISVVEPTISVVEPSTPISEVEPTPPIPPLTIAPPSPPSSQSISDVLLTSQQSISETLNGSSSYLQSFDVRPMMAAPVFTKNLQDVLAVESQLVVLECRVKGIPSPKVDWYREGTLIEDSPDFRILQKKPRSMAESEEICTLVIAEVFPEDSGTFTCIANNKYGTVSSTAVLRVKGHNNNSTNPKTTSTLTVESSLQKVPATELMSTTLKHKPDVPLVNNKLHSSMICLDPLRSGFKHSDLQDSGTPRSDSLNPRTLRHDLTTSLPSLNPLSIGKYSSDTLRTSLPQLDPLSFSSSSLNSDSNHKPLSSSTTHFDSGGSGFKPSTQVTQSPPNGSASSITMSSDASVEPLPNGSKPTPSPSVTSFPPVNCSNHQERPTVKPLPDPPTSCLKTRPEGVLGNHNESSSSSRVGLRVTFKLLEDEDEEEKGMSSKEPPPVLAKPKLDPVQLQILHNQVLLEQRQEDASPSQDSPHLDRTSCEPLPVKPTHPPANSVPSQLQPPPLVMNSAPIPLQIPASVPLLPTTPAPILKAVPVSQLSMPLTNSMPLPQLTPSATTLHNHPPIPQQNLVPTTLSTVPPGIVPSNLLTQPNVVPTPPQLNLGPISPNVAPVTPMPSVIPTIPITQPGGAPNIPMPINLGPSARFPQLIMAPTTQSNPNHVANVPPVTSSTHISQINMNPTMQIYSVPQPNVVPTPPQLNLGPISPNVAPVTPMPSVIPTIPITQPGGAPNIPMPINLGPSARFPQLIMAPTTQSNPKHVANVPPVTSSTHISQINMNPTMQIYSVPVSDTSVARTQALMSPNASVVNNTGPKLNTTTSSHPSMAPQDTHSQGVSYPPLSKITSPHQVRNQPAPIPSPMSPPPLIDTQPPLPGIIPISTKSFTYTRPKEFIAAQMLSPIRSPSPTESPVPMLHELAAQIFPKSTRELTSPVNQLSPSPRKFPTRVLECPSSPPYVSSPPLLPPGLVNSLFSFRTQSPPQASSPTSSNSTPSPIQNPVAFLSSVLPSLPISPPTNAMGLPKRAPPGPQGALKKNQRGSRLMSDDDIRESKETLLQDIEKKLRFKDEQLRFGQQEYKVSSFEQRLLSEIEFRLERTPVEESDDEVQHDEIPSGKCIAPIFDKKLKHFRAVEGIPVTFTCKVVGIPIPKVSGLPHPEIMWLLNGKPIYPDLTHRMLVRENGIHSLVIDPLTQADDGTYTCIASNKAGQSSFGLELRVVAQWYQHFHAPMKKTQLSGSRYAALTGQGLDIKSAFSMSDNGPVIISASQPERRVESEEL
ncbi:myopalladin-like [Sinocyclocheilus rhinocerous]|uniref:myopalladin-like n=1 Tax=Sinocyclocheilus rhinocerous TaxID=307959 RepID=UPI0007BAABB3|nr:PREDICTED: myopalladin-like [Sinocyclocheilus rhinocerous]